MSKKSRAEGTRCSRMPGECFDSEAAANDMRVTRQMNVARGGMGQVVYHVRRCSCGKHHLLTDEHLQRWESARRAARVERKRNG